MFGTVPMISMIVPQFFSDDIARTLADYRDRLGFATAFCYGDPPHYAGAARDGCLIYFRHVDRMAPWPEDKYELELLDAYFHVRDVRSLHAEMQAKGVAFARALGTMPWNMIEFVATDGDGRLLCFGEDVAAADSRPEE
jgi:hypothetical protein